LSGHAFSQQVSVVADMAGRSLATGLLLFVALVGAVGEEIKLKLAELTSGYVEEDDFLHYAAHIPPSAPAVKVIITPIFGDPDVYLSFFTAEPDDTTATWMMDEMGTEERLIRRQATDFCTGEPCILHISVYGYEASEFRLAVYNTSDIGAPGGDAPKCAANCNEFDLSDGICDTECNSTACFYDGGDCLVTHSRGTCDWRTRAGCPSSWIGDGVCDEECFVEECEWDGNDCSQGQGEEICHPGCMSSWINDGECDEECHFEECGYDGKRRPAAAGLPGSRSAATQLQGRAPAQMSPRMRRRWGLRTVELACGHWGIRHWGCAHRLCSHWSAHSCPLLGFAAWACCLWAGGRGSRRAASFALEPRVARRQCGVAAGIAADAGGRQWCQEPWLADPHCRGITDRR
jgi:hypothetical protein